ncbi:MAG: hypothetical protein IPM54_25055 [Polyangiaceae bacterium]|nr:hypothetical protein [Polyangiaceae bacterium]
MIVIDAPSIAPSGPWVQFIVATPDGTFEWPPEPYGWGAALVKVKSKSAKDNQKAAGRGKAKTKKSGPQPLEVTIEMTFTRARFSEPLGACAILNALDPNNPNGNGGPFDFMSADFNRRLGKSIDVDEVGEVVWQGHKGTCTITAKEWVPEPPKEAEQGTATPTKSTEHTPGDENAAVPQEGTKTIARGGLTIDPALSAAARAAQKSVTLTRVKSVAARGFDGPEKPTVKP